MGFLSRKTFHPTNVGDLKPARSHAEIIRVRQGYVLILLNVVVALRVFHII